ncbi:MAG: MarR family transcriptional regulator [Actinobacteria bacterium]|nr:MarR family transcriptional regulator [Actinomycetota bacterium]MCB8997683.1 MarR family transcriptional regulator [Actinomycetota bacterium]MCB9423915.1 MarR family transcriptional regulator [Actinomycetota bacterium]HRY09105.1 MarR family transcriptional regulator [Candidatus Nanopelagicales bacterium]
MALVVTMGERFVNRELAGTGVTSGTAPLLLELRDGGYRSPADLARATGVDKSHVTRSLRSLQRAGLVAVEPDPGDGRKLVVSLTPAGRGAAGAAEQAMGKWLGIVSQGVEPTDLRTVDGVFERFYANAMRHFNTE